MKASNSQKLCEALERIRDSFYIDPDDNKCNSDIDASDLREICDVALSEPPRNCDIGTAEEQFIRWEKLCESYGGQCSKCKFYTSCDLSAKCFAKWSQMPYEKGGAE